MHRHMGGVGALSLAALMSLSSGASGELALSANDGKAVLIDGVNAVPANPPADSVTVIDPSATPPKVVAEIPAPTSVIGPPSSVAIARDESFALVTGASKIDPADPKKTVPDDKVTVIDLKASPPKVAAQLQAGQGAAGVSINRAGTLALVANRSEGTGSVFSIAGNALTPVGKVNLGDDKSGPSRPSHRTARRRWSPATATTRFPCCRSTATRSSTPNAISRRGCGPTGSSSIPTARSRPWRTSGRAAAMPIP